MQKYGQQIGCIVYGRGINPHAYAADAIARGLVVVFRAGHATIHRATA